MKYRRKKPRLYDPREPTYADLRVLFPTIIIAEWIDGKGWTFPRIMNPQDGEHYQLIIPKLNLPIGDN